MAFLLRSLSRSADGREIVRESRVADNILRIGRDPVCDIRLNDLAVALHHATIELVGEGAHRFAWERGMTPRDPAVLVVERRAVDRRGVAQERVPEDVRGLVGELRGRAALGDDLALLRHGHARGSPAVPGRRA